jgi:hypothetical protein
MSTAADPRPGWTGTALHDQRRRLVKALPADCRESGSRGSKLSVGAKWNEQTFICIQSNVHDPCGNTCRRSDHADRNITDSDDRLWCQEHTVHYDRDRARPHLDSEDGAIGGEYHAFFETIPSRPSRQTAANILSPWLDAPYKSGPSKAWLKIKNPKAPAATRAIDGTFYGRSRCYFRHGYPGSTSSTGGCRIAIVSPNDNAVSSTQGTLLPPNWIEVFRCSPGQRVSAISNDAGTFSLSITELTD